MEDKISTNDERFHKAAEGALRRLQDLILLHRPAYTAGQQDWYLIRSMEDLERALKLGKSRSSFTIFLGRELPVRGVVGPETVHLAGELLRKHGEILLARICADRFTLDAKGTEEMEDVIAFLGENHGAEFAMGRLPRFWVANPTEEITAYVPDADGVIRPGSY